ncbi:MAG: hypothetical protein ACRYFV_08310 [Janthinobacterium lividum]
MLVISLLAFHPRALVGTSYAMAAPGLPISDRLIEHSLAENLFTISDKPG